MPRPNQFARRHLTSEMMDNPRIEPHEHRAALAGLRRLNAIGRSADLIWPAIERELRRAYGRRLVLLDIATGGGDVLAEIARRGGERLECHGLDISNTALAEARRRCPPGLQFHRADLFGNNRWAGPDRPDIITCSLFLHHLETAQIVSLLGQMRRRARRLVILGELERSWLAWYAIGAAARIATRSPIVHFDSLRSVEAGFRPRELAALAKRAGMDGAIVRRSVPFRLLMQWNQPRIIA